MPITIKHRQGRADESINPSGSATDTMYGPSPTGTPNYRGVYVIQSPGVFRCIEEHYTPGVASPTGFTYAVK